MVWQDVFQCCKMFNYCYICIMWCLQQYLFCLLQLSVCGLSVVEHGAARGRLTPDCKRSTADSSGSSSVFSSICAVLLSRGLVCLLLWSMVQQDVKLLPHLHSVVSSAASVLSSSAECVYACCFGSCYCKTINCSCICFA
jgi:hypothetical protein